MYKLLSHNDLDGVGCGIVAKLAFGKDVDVRYNSVSSLDREVKYFLENGDKETFLLITDLSVNEENEQALNEFYQSGGQVQMIDHHKTALPFNAYEWADVSVEDENGKLHAATSLLYDYLVTEGHLEPSEGIEEFVELVRQYDTWEWEANENQKAQRLNALFFLVSIDEFEETMLERLQERASFDFDEFEKRLLDMEENKIQRYIRRKRKQLIQKKVGSHYAGIVHAESYHSELGNQLGKDYPHLDYIVILNMGGRRMGFRTIHDDVDVSEVAGEYGGGGHAKAAGSLMTEEAFKTFVQEAFQLEPLREDAWRNRYNRKASSFGSLYQDRSDALYFVHPQQDGQWVIDRNHKTLEGTYKDFWEAEKALKKEYEAWLVRDDMFVSFLMKQLKK
ncbi:DHH family phosphoesterase [Virgibacillus sediminis]|uniref:DHH family phosphoesterase n=1 Tax=Virgibacillus sediminis TaxID=202260 RepID=A0ABV7A1Y4_9BACI